jgi:hypothetical protein
MIKWLLKFGGWQLYAAFALAVAALALAWKGHTVYLRGQINTAKAAQLKAETYLTERIRLESEAIEKAVKATREEELKKQKDQEVKYEELQRSVRSGRTSLVTAEQRVQQLAKAARSACDSSRPNSAPITGDASPAGGGELREEDRKLISELLQIAGDADQAVHERNWVVEQYISHCERK